MKHFEVKMKERWERRLEKRGGYPKKRCARYTKPGPRPRARPKWKDTVQGMVSNSQIVSSEIFLQPAVRVDTGEYMGSQRLYSIWNTQGDTVLHVNQEEPGSWRMQVKETTFSSSTATTYSFDYPYVGDVRNIFNTTSGNDSLDIFSSGDILQYGASLSAIPCGTASTSSFTVTLPYYLPYTYVAETPEERKKREQNEFRQRIRNGLLAPLPRTRATKQAAIFENVSQAELVALSLLKTLLPKNAWRRYLTYGFILVRGESGLTYQVIRGQDHVRVYSSFGKKVSELCIRIGNRLLEVPPTDAVIGKKILIEYSETELWAKANIRSHRFWNAGYTPSGKELYELSHSNRRLLDEFSNVA